MVTTQRVGRFAWILVACAALAACASREVGRSGGASAVAPTLVVERFLRAANTNELRTMAELFGTREGSILKRDDESAVEKRMFLIANILKHEDFRFAGEGIVPGRSDEAVRLLVQVRKNGTHHTVPFTVVRSEGGRWLVEAVALEVITAGQGASW